MNLNSNVFHIKSGTYIEISDGFIRLTNTNGSTDIRYEEHFTLAQLSECLRKIVSDPEKYNGEPIKNWDLNLSVSVEFDDTEDHSNIFFSYENICIIFCLKKSKLPNLIQFFFNNSSR